MTKVVKTASELESILSMRLAVKEATVRVSKDGAFGWDAVIVQLPETPTYFAHRFRSIVEDMRTEYDLKD